MKIKRIFEKQYLDTDKRPCDALNIVLHLRSHAEKMLTLLWDFHTSVCFDPRDHIFALSSLAENIHETDIGLSVDQQQARRALVDYGEDWIDTYCRFVHDCIDTGYEYELLQHLFAFGSLSESLNDLSIPSYVPNWTKKRKQITSKMENFRPTGPLFSMHDSIGGRHSNMVATEVTTSWPAPSSFVEERYGFGSRIHQLLAYGVLDGYLHIDEAAKKVLGIEFDLPAEASGETWRKLSYTLQLKIGADITIKPMAENRNDSVIAWFMDITGTYTLFISTPPRGATKSISHRGYTDFAIGQGKIEPGDIVVKGHFPFSMPRAPIDTVWRDPQVGLVVRKNSRVNLEAAVEFRGNMRVIEHFRIVGTCLYIPGNPFG
jgi:hypothetical protein